MKVDIKGNATLQAVLTAGKIYQSSVPGTNQDVIIIKASNGNQSHLFKIDASECGNMALINGVTTRVFLSAGALSYLSSTTLGLAIGANSKDANALLDVQSTTLGLKVPTMTAAQKGGIGNSAGLIVFDTNAGKLCVNTGAGWQTITSA